MKRRGFLGLLGGGAVAAIIPLELIPEPRPALSINRLEGPIRHIMSVHGAPVPEWYYRAVVSKVQHGVYGETFDTLN